MIAESISFKLCHSAGRRFTFYGTINKKGCLMGAVAYSEHYTYDDYIQWDGDWELIEGHPYAMASAPMITHQALAMQIAFEFERSIQKPPR